MYGLVLSEERPEDAAWLAKELLQRGVDTRPFFLGLHQQPAFQQRGLFVGEQYPITEHLGRRGLYLPTGIALTEGQIEQVCTAVHGVLR